MDNDRFAFTGPHIPVAPIATGVDLANGLDLSVALRDLPAECSVREPGVIMGCRGVMSARNNDPAARYRWDATGDTVRCLHCGADVTAATTANVWREMLAPAVPALPSQPSALDELLAAARYAAEYLSPAPPTEGKPMKAGVILRAAIRRYEAQR